MSYQTKWIVGILLAGMAAAGLIVWFVLLSGPSAEPAGNANSPTFGTSDTRSTTGSTQVGDTSTGEPVISSGVSTQKIFKITDGPVAGAALLVTTRPTTTVARFVLASNGHILDLPLDTPGAVPRAISNTTIPGITGVLWSEQGRGALMQYIDSDALKTAHFALPAAASTSSTPVRVQFLPAGVMSPAVSPDGVSVAYLIKTAAGADGYTAKADGTGAKKVFSLPFSQLLLSWPSTDTLLAGTAPAAGVPGAVFSINAKTGGSSALLYASGVTATANRTFGTIVYQTADSSTRATYARDTKTGLSKALSFDPLPEQCAWSIASSTTLYCAAPLSAVPANYLDLWHAGVAGVADGIIAFDFSTGRSYLAAAPGGSEGGEESNIAELAVSPDDKYLLFVRKGDRSLWAVRLSQ